MTADLRPVLETVSGPAAEKQYVRPIGVHVDQEVAIRAVLVLANLGADQRSAG